MAFLVHAGLNFWHFLIDLIHKSITYFKTLKTKTAAAETKLRFFCLFLIIVLVVVLVWIWEFIVSHLPEKKRSNRELKGCCCAILEGDGMEKVAIITGPFYFYNPYCIKLCFRLIFSWALIIY